MKTQGCGETGDCESEDGGLENCAEGTDGGGGGEGEGGGEEEG